jgi:hypothetical protein
MTDQRDAYDTSRRFTSSFFLFCKENWMQLYAVMDVKRKIVLLYSLVRAVVGYFVFHPLVMLFSYMMTIKDAALDMTSTVGFIPVILRSFSIDMLPWSLSFAMFNSIIGLYYGILKAEKLARDELIRNLQKAMADVKTLSGMLPICVWCKK